MFGFKTISKRKYNDLIDHISSQRKDINELRQEAYNLKDKIIILNKVKTSLETKVNKLQRNRDKKGRFIK